MTTLAEARSAVRQRFDTLIGTGLGITVFHENARDTVPTNESWCDLILREVQTSRIEIGHEFLVRDRSLGIAYLYTPTAIGTKAADDIADAIESGFSHMTVDEITYLDATIRTIGVDGGWFRKVVEFPFYSERVKTLA